MNKTILILGGDGYLGWSLGLHRACNTDDRVILVDSYLKRDLQKSLGIKELHEFPLLPERIRSYTGKTGRRNLSSLSVDTTNYEAISGVISRYKPDVIVNAAHQPSAPLSMKSPYFSALTISNNERSCMSVLWAVHKLCVDSVIINLGSAGVYQSVDAGFIPETRKTLHFTNDGTVYSVIDSWLPMQTSDFYHQSKVHTFGMTDMCTQVWDLKTITVQQSTIFGQCVNNELNVTDLYSRFNYDHIFGTVLNRFACQIVKGMPLTIYGDGDTQTNIICLCDALRCINGLIDLDVEPGYHKVVNNYTGTMSIKSLAEKVVEVYGKGDIEFIKNPRKERVCNQIKVFDNNLKRTDSNTESSIRDTLDFADRFSYNINTEQFAPTIEWAR